MTNTQKQLARLNKSIENKKAPFTPSDQPHPVDYATVSIAVNGNVLGKDSFSKMLDVVRDNLGVDIAENFTQAMRSYTPYNVEFEKGVTATLAVVDNHISPYSDKGLRIANSSQYNTVSGEL